MPRAPRLPTTKNGRPKKIIDWEMIDKWLMAGCDGSAVARKFGMHPNTFYERVMREKGVSFSEYQQQKLTDGNALLHQVQYKKALNGDNTMLVWLGKNRMLQSDKVESKTEIKGEVTIKAILELPDNGRRNKNG
jgi:hypothetical protein